MTTSKSSKRTPREFVADHTIRILLKLGCGDSVKERAESIISLGDKQNLLTKANPKYLASGIVYISCILADDRVSLDSIGGVIEASSSTVSKHYMMISQSLNFGER